MEILKSQIMDNRLEELAAREKMIDGLRALSLGARLTRKFCETELGYTVFETRALLGQLGLILLSESLVSSDAEVQARIDKLRDWRKHRASAEGVPAYRVLTNHQLMKVASDVPKTSEELRELKGFGMKRTTTYASELIALLKS
jgi:superfamily II DNA helicase RecQ